jgi:[ribosomal protein S5]-alanine N-acetyltransferase
MGFVLQTERLTLREITISDAAFLLRLLNEPSFIRNIGDRNVRTIADAERYALNGPIASYKQHGFGLYLVVLKETGILVTLLYRRFGVRGTRWKRRRL